MNDFDNRMPMVITWVWVGCEDIAYLSFAMLTEEERQRLEGLLNEYAKESSRMRAVDISSLNVHGSVPIGFLAACDDLADVIDDPELFGAPKTKIALYELLSKFVKESADDHVQGSADRAAEAPRKPQRPADGGVSKDS